MPNIIKYHQISLMKSKVLWLSQLDPMVVWFNHQSGMKAVKSKRNFPHPRAGKLVYGPQKNADLCPISGKERRLHAGGWIYRRGGDIKPAISGAWTQRWVQSSSGFSHGQNSFDSTGAIFPSLVGGFKHLDDFPFHIWDVIFPIDFHSIIFQDGHIAAAILYGYHHLIHHKHPVLTTINPP